MRFFDILPLASAELSLKCSVHKDRQFAIVAAENGTSIRVLQARFPLNLATGSRAAGDKSITKAVLIGSGHPVVEGWSVNLGGDWQAAFECLSRLGGHAIVKPTNGERGSLVFLCRSAGQLAFALSQIVQRHASAMIEEYIEGTEYRVLILDSRPLYVLERRRLSLLADGTSTIIDLIAAQVPGLLPTLLADPRMSQMAGTPPLTAILPAGVPFTPIPAANLVAALTLSIEPSTCAGVVRLAASAVATLGLRYAGVDVIVERKSDRMSLLEVNSAPELEGFDSQGQPCLAASVAACRALLSACFS